MSANSNNAPDKPVDRDTMHQCQIQRNRKTTLRHLVLVDVAHTTAPMRKTAHTNRARTTQASTTYGGSCAHSTTSVSHGHHSMPGRQLHRTLSAQRGGALEARGTTSHTVHLSELNFENRSDHKGNARRAHVTPYQAKRFSPT